MSINLNKWINRRTQKRKDTKSLTSVYGIVDKFPNQWQKPLDGHKKKSKYKQNKRTLLTQQHQHIVQYRTPYHILSNSYIPMTSWKKVQRTSENVMLTWEEITRMSLEKLFNLFICLCLPDVWDVFYWVWGLALLDFRECVESNCHVNYLNVKNGPSSWYSIRHNANSQNKAEPFDY